MGKLIVKFIIGLVLIFIAGIIFYAIFKKSGSVGAELSSGESQYEEGMGYLASGNTNKALKELEVSFSQGYFKAAAGLGSCYFKVNDLPNASKYLNMAKDSIQLFSVENKRVIYNQLGIVYDQQKDKKNAEKYWRKAAALGSEDAKRNLLR